jgi:hypothetical protein
MVVSQMPDREREKTEMTSVAWIILIVGIIVIVGTILLFKARTQKLKSKFGPEYDRVVQERGSSVTAEKELETRAKRVENSMSIHSLKASAINLPQNGEGHRSSLSTTPAGR